MSRGTGATFTTKKYQCNRCGACVFSKRAADKHWEETCPKLKKPVIADKKQ